MHPALARALRFEAAIALQQVSVHMVIPLADCTHLP